MPELPDIVVYIECLETRISGRPLEGVRLLKDDWPRTVQALEEGPKGGRRHG